MTNKQELNSPAITRLFSNGRVRPRVATEEVLEAIHQKPIPTVWAYGQGRPILDRLPAVEEQYQKGYEGDQNYVYLDPQLGKYEGPGSLQPKKSQENPSVITLESGIVTWKMGQLEVPASSFDVSDYLRYGLADGTFKIGHILSFEIPEIESPIPGHALVNVSRSSLSEAFLIPAANRETEDHEDYKAISTSEVNGSWWPSLDLDTKEYCDGTWIALDFGAPVTASRFELIADKQYSPTSEVAAFYSDDGAVWTLADQTFPVGEFWNLDVSASADTPHRYWRFWFWDGSASLSNIAYTGTAYYPDQRLTRPIQQSTLRVENLYDESPENFILIAQFKVRQREIVSVADYRTFTSRKYEPVSDWLTSFQDIGLRGLFSVVESYSSQYMNPVSADYHLYREMGDTVWFGEGQITVGGSANIYDPAEIVDAEHNLGPEQIICLMAPTEDADHSTKVYTDTLFSEISIDNGIYF